MWGREDYSKRVGSLAQLARIDSFVEQEGPARGARRIRMITGGGLEVDVHPDRAFDLGQVTYRGVPVAWMSPTGIAAPALYDSTDWLRTFGGGMLATCGLDTFGPGRETPVGVTAMHGRVGGVPGRLTRAHVTDEALVVEGEIRQASVFGEDLVLRRTITAELGGARFTVDDTVQNVGTESTPHAILYHCNLGWPLLDEEAALSVPSTAVEPVNAEAGVDGDWKSIRAPRAGIGERVFAHSLPGSDVTIVVDNPRVDVRLSLTVDGSRLPRLAQWVMLGEQHYVMGIEPTNAKDVRQLLSGGTSVELPRLTPGECARYALAFEFGASHDRTPEKLENLLC